MNICPYCETQLDSDAIYCTNCGTKINQNKVYTNTGISSSTDSNNNSHVYIPYQHRYRLDKRTSELKIVLVLEYFLLVNVIFASLAILVVNPGLGFIAIVVSGLYFYLVYLIQQFNNTARIVLIILLVIGLLVTIVSFNIIGIAFCIFQIYALGFHKQTIDLFSKKELNLMNF